MVFCIPGLMAYGQGPLYREVNSLPMPRQMHGAVVMGDYLYVLGGNNPSERYVTTVYKAQIKTNGALGTWEQTTDLPEQKSYIENSTLVLNDVVYVVAGFDGTNSKSSNAILWSRPGENGRLEEWKKSDSFPGDGVHCAVAVATPGYIHLIGGLQDIDQPTDKVWSVAISPDGTIAGWEQSPGLPTTLWYHCGGVSGSYVWIWGGLTTRKDDSVNTAVYYAPILSSGKIGPWKKYASPLPVGFYAASNTVSGSFLLSFCPRYAGRTLSNDIWFAQASSKGLSPWKKLPSNLPSCIYIGLATDYRRGYVYIPGGRPDDVKKTVLNKNVFVFKLQESETQIAGTDIAHTMAGGQESGNQYSFMHPTSLALGDLPGFVSYEQARSAPGLPMLVYFHSQKATKCITQEQILQNFNPEPYSGKLSLAKLDTALFPQIAQQYGVFKVPCWIYFDARGNVVDRKYGIIQVSDLKAILQWIEKR